MSEAQVTGPPLGPGAPPVSASDVIEQVSEAFTFEAGHQARRARCLLCAALIGGRSVRAVTVTDYRVPLCLCGSVASVTFLICAEHSADPDTDYMAPAMLRWSSHHQGRPS